MSGGDQDIFWTGDDRVDTNGPKVYLEFDGHFVDISTTPDFHNEPDMNDQVRSYNFGNELPNLGEGIGLVNTTGSDSGGYNMHFGAVTRNSSGGGVKISNMMEGDNVEPAKLHEFPLRHNVNEFRDTAMPPGFDEGRFAMGKLTTDKPEGKQQIGRSHQRVLPDLSELDARDRSASPPDTEQLEPARGRGRDRDRVERYYV